MREVLEELAVRLDIGELLIIDWLPNRPPKTEGLMLLFDGGRLNNTTTCRFSLPADELSEWAFVAADRLDAFLPAVIARRVRVGLARMEGGGTVYLESGRPPGSADDERLPRRGGEEAYS